MAKIYETQQDFERDKLDQQASQLQVKSHIQNNTGWAFFSASLLADAWNLAKAVPSRAISWMSSAFLVVSVIEFIQSWRTGSKAQDLKLERERLGPARVVYPPENQPETEITSAAIQRALQARTLMQHAEKSDNAVSHQV